MAEIESSVYTSPEAQPIIDGRTVPLTEQAPRRVREPDGTGELEELSTMPTPIALSDGEGWATPAVLQDSVWQSDQANDLLPPSHPIVDTKQPDTQGADDWLDGIADEIGEVWLYGPPDSGPSPQTSMVTDPRTTGGRIYKGCKCDEHQEAYIDWPTQNADLTIAQCMKVCMYCGKDFTTAAELRKHLRQSKYSKQNLAVQMETRGKGSSLTLSWTQRRRTEPPITRSEARRTRTQSHIDRENRASLQC
ncbi:hypothetical protein PMG11_11202 [Penicillium brasilianum]|uniref:C2H2-type domain-containing protein n=1 Tax=Penicillium brasilianum TaxID=104259 RepID=A0A0F7U157_PENBI|nr:hypothetical protein PMG11_11202 [Penicillium brasilianum]